MARWAFLIDFEWGHLLPTLEVAAGLEAIGHEVRYLSIPDNVDRIQREGFRCEPVLGEVYPRGFLARHRERFGDDPESGDQELVSHQEMLAKGSSLDRAIRAVDPDLILAGYFLSLEALTIWYRHRVPVAFLTPILRVPASSPDLMVVEQLMRRPDVAEALLEMVRAAGLHAARREDLVLPLAEVPELIQCPAELDFPGRRYPPNVHHVEPSVRRSSSAPIDGFDWTALEGEGRLVYVSLGSTQYRVRERVTRVYRRLFGMMRRCAEAGRPWRFLVSIDRRLSLDELGEPPPNATVVRWAPQVEVLERSASAAIIHGGLGSVKECLLHGVPMVVIPSARDQPDNGRRVEHHHLGVTLDPEDATEEALLGALSKVLDDSSVTTGVPRLQRLFARQEERRPGVRLLDRLVRWERPVRGADAPRRTGREKLVGTPAR